MSDGEKLPSDWLTSCQPAAKQGASCAGSAVGAQPADFAVGDPKTFLGPLPLPSRSRKTDREGDRKKEEDWGEEKERERERGGRTQCPVGKASTRCRVSLSPRPLVLTLLMTLDMYISADRHAQRSRRHCDFRRNRRPRTAEASLKRRHVCFASVALDGVGVADLMKAAGLSPTAAFTTIFPRKRRLAAEACTAAFEGALAALNKLLGAGKLESGFRKYIDKYLSPSQPRRARWRVPHRFLAADAWRQGTSFKAPTPRASKAFWPPWKTTLPIIRQKPGGKAQPQEPTAKWWRHVLSRAVADANGPALRGNPAGQPGKAPRSSAVTEHRPEVARGILEIEADLHGVPRAARCMLGSDGSVLRTGRALCRCGPACTKAAIMARLALQFRSNNLCDVPRTLIAVASFLTRSRGWHPPLDEDKIVI